MQRIVGDDTAVLPLWTGASASSPKVTVPSDGFLLNIRVEKKRFCSPTEMCCSVSAFTFHPLDHSRAVFGLTDGSIYGVDIAAGQLFLLTKVSDAAVTTMSFSGTLVDWLVCCTAGKRVAHILDWETGSESQEWSLERQHTTPVERLYINSLQGVVMFCSPGEVSCWSFDYTQALTDANRRIPFRLLSFGKPLRKEALRVSPILTDYGVLTAMTDTPATKCRLERWRLPSAADYHQNSEMKGDKGFELSVAALAPFEIECFCALPSAHVVAIASERDVDGCSRQVLALIDSQSLQGVHRANVSVHAACRCVNVSCALTRVHNSNDLNGLVGLTYEDNSALIIDLRSGQSVFQWRSSPSSSLLHFCLSSCVLAAVVADQEVSLVHLPSAIQRYQRQHAPAPADEAVSSTPPTLPDRLPVSLNPQYFSQWVDASSLASYPVGKKATGATQQSAKLVAGMLYKEERDDSTPGDGPVAYAENFHKMRGYLKRYGCYPSSHRSVIWRYMLGLPHPSHTTAIYAALARKPQHHCVSAFLEGLPLPQTHAEVQQRLEKIISMLAWHSSVFGILECLPAILYPFVHVLYDKDNVDVSMQTNVEVALIFFLNWGQEFFTHHPQAPPILTTFVTQLLEQEDEALFHHLQSINCPAEVWGWEVLQVLLTDALTASEWLQMMDHALSTVPLWMWVFHVCLLKARRAELLGCSTSIEVLQALQTNGRQSNPVFSVVAVIQDTYRLFGLLMLKREKSTSPNAAWPPLLVAVPAAYLSFHSIEWSKDEKTRWQYPMHFNCHPDVLRERIREVSLRAQKLRELQEAEHLRAVRELKEKQSVLEHAYIQQQEERLQLAKRDAEAEKRQSEVLLGKVQQAIHEEFMNPPVHDALPYPLVNNPTPYPLDESTRTATIVMSPVFN